MRTGDVRSTRRVIVKPAILICIGIGALALGVSARGGGSAAGAHASTPVTVKAAYNKQLNKTIVVDARGITLYAFFYDEKGKPACYTDPSYKCKKTWPSCVDDPEYHCVKSWPPLIVSAKPRAGKGIKANLLRTARRRDGHLQVTYNRLPLYYYAGGLGPPADKRPGDINGHTFGGLWWAVSSSGKEIK
jgi:predicted lipoprotein with Yx(FWY)xxD motif